MPPTCEALSNLIYVHLRSVNADMYRRKKCVTALQCQWAALAKLQELRLESVMDLRNLWQLTALTALKKVSIVASTQSSMSTPTDPHSQRIMMESIRPDFALFYVELQPSFCMIAVHIRDWSPDLNMCAVKLELHYNHVPEST